MTLFPNARFLDLEFFGQVELVADDQDALAVLYAEVRNLLVDLTDLLSDVEHMDDDMRTANRCERPGLGVEFDRICDREIRKR